MAVSIAASAADDRPRGVAWPVLVEAALVGVAIAALLPLFGPLQAQERGRDDRFAPAAGVRDLPAPVLPQLCSTHGAGADADVRDRLCGAGVVPADPVRLDRLPRVLVDAAAFATRAFVAPLEASRVRLAALRQQTRDEGADAGAIDRAIADELARIGTYARRHGLDAEAGGPPRGLACAIEAIRGPGGGVGEGRSDAGLRARANAVLLFGAALDAHPAVSALLGASPLPTARASSPRCDGLDTRQSLAAVTALMRDARASVGQRAKDDAMRALLRTARWQWAGWAALGLVLLHVARLGIAPATGTGIALAAWAVAAWLGRVPWPLGSGTVPAFARDTEALPGLPAGFVVAMLVAAAGLLVTAPWRAKPASRPRSAPASAIAYPGLVVATGIGWLLLLDLSANATFANRYLALYHHGHLWLAMLAFSLVAIWRRPLVRSLAWMLAFVDGVAGRVAARLGAIPAGAVFVAVAMFAVAAIALPLADTRQLTSELGRLWLVIGAAWFFFLRGTPLTERIARSGTTMASLARYLAPLLFVVVVLVAAMAITRDMGPLLVAGYGAGAFVAASVAMWSYQRHAATRSAFVVAVVAFAAWIVATTLALYRFGALDPVTAARLENVAAPLVSANDQLALVTWFQRATPAAGFGPGAVPWCGFGASTTCAGVPAQIQSDYTFTALVGVFGWTGAWILTLGCTLWLVGALRPHGRVTRGEPRLVRVAGRLRNDEQALASWLGVAWVVMTLCQLAVTVAGNLAVIPLTGVTFPFVSFGMTSLTVNLAMLALIVDVTPAGGPR